MSVTVDFPLFGKPTVSVDDLVRWSTANGGTDDQDIVYLRALNEYCRAVGIDPAFAAGQWADECTNPQTGRLGDSEYWRRDGNPAGIGIWKSGVPSPWSGKLTPQQSAAVHVVEILAHTNPDAIDLRPWMQEAARIDAAHLAALRSVRSRSDWPNPDVWRLRHLCLSVGGSDFVWAASPDYAVQIARHITRLYTYRRETPSVAIKAIPCDIDIAVVTRSQNNRPQNPMDSASFVTIHEVGNLSPGADEFMHRDFVHNGGGVNQVSFHLIVGPTKAFQLIYFNENAWHASDGFYGRGNRDSIAIETVQIGPFDQTIGHLVYVVAEIFRNPDRFAFRPDFGRIDDLDPALYAERLKQHNNFAPDLKNCPQFIRDRGLWLPFLAGVGAELKSATPQPVQRYKPPIVPEFWSEKALIELRRHEEDGVVYRPMGTRLAAIRNTGAYVHGFDPAAKGQRTRADIKKGEVVDLRYTYINPANNKPWGITRHGTHIALDYYSPHITLKHLQG